MTRIRYAAFTLLFLAGSSLYGQDGHVRALALQEALKLARQHSYAIQMARSQVEQAKGRSLESLSGFLPHVSLSENYVRSNDPVTVFGLKLKQGVFSQQDFSLSSLNHPDAFDNFSTTFQVQQPVLNLDAIYGKSAASLGVAARKAAARRVEETILLNVKKAYFGLVLATEKLRAIEDALRSARRHRDDAKAAFQQGLVNQADYLGAEVRLSELEEQRITASHEIANASDALKFLMGIEDEARIVPTDTLSVPDSLPAATSLASLGSTRADLQAIAFQKKAANRNLWMKRSSWVPRLNAFGAVEWNASQAFSKDASNWAVGFQLKWQLFEGFGKFGRAKQAAARHEQAEVQYRQAEEKARMEVRRARRALQAARQRLEVARSAVDQARESLRIVEARFAQGLEKTSDLLDKEVALTNAKLRLLKAKYDVTISASELNYALGEQP